MIEKLQWAFVRMFMRTRFYNWLLTDIIPYIRFTTYYTSMRAKVAFVGYEVLKPGHIILTVDEKKLTTKLISKFTGEEGFSHAALCVSKDKNFEIAEMTHKNFTKSCFFDVCYEATRVVILECYDFDEKYVKEMVGWTKSLENVPYDNYFSLGVDALSCSELIYAVDYERRLKVDLKPIIGKEPYISPMGLYQAKNVKVIWDSNWSK
jgi:hypothetical protein